MSQMRHEFKKLKRDDMRFFEFNYCCVNCGLITYVMTESGEHAISSHNKNITKNLFHKPSDLISCIENIIKDIIE